MFLPTYHFPSLHFPKPLSLRPLPLSLLSRHAPPSLRLLATRRRTPQDADPPEAPEDSAHGFSKFQQIQIHADRAKKLQQDDFLTNQSLYLNAIADHSPPPPDASGDDLFGDIDRAIALKRDEFVKQGLIKPPQDSPPLADSLSPDELLDVEELEELQSSRADVDADADVDEDFIDVGDETGFVSPTRVLEVRFRMTLAELLDECRVVPVAVSGDLEVEISGIQYDAGVVASGDLFVCCAGKGESDTWLVEADKRGAVAVVAKKEVNLGETLGCKALVIVEDPETALRSLAAAFYKHPSKSMAVIGIVGSKGKTSTAYLVKGMYDAVGLRTGMLSSLSSFIHGSNKVESPGNDAVSVQSLMAKMVHNGTEAVVVESYWDEEIDYDVAVFTNLGENEEIEEVGKMFEKMRDPERQRKVVNIDDKNAAFLVGRGNPEVPVVSFAMEDKKADVYPLKYSLSLFETQVLVNTPCGILEISSGLLGRHNVVNILAAVAVGIAVNAPLEEIVRGIEEIDAVPGRLELIDEEQAFGVIVDHARTPESLSSLLDCVKELKPKRIITVVGCVGEGERGKRPMMTKVATEKSDVTMLTSDNPRNEDPLEILDDMLAGVGWTMQDYLKHGESDYYPPLPNGHRLFLHDIRRVAVRCAVAMGEEGDVVVDSGILRVME